MEIYLVITNSLEEIRKLYEVFKNLFWEQREEVGIRSSFDEDCLGVARELAAQIDRGFAADHDLCDPNSVERFWERGRLSESTIRVFVLTPGVAWALMKIVDPQSTRDSIPLNSILRLRDIAN